VRAALVRAALVRAALVRAALAAVAVAAASFVSLRAATAEDLVPVRVDYEARAGCPDADAFTREVLARAPRARLAAPTEQARALVVRIRGADHALEGSLVVRDVDGTKTAARSVHAHSCEELATALAVITAVVIDPVTAKLGAIDAGADDAASTAPDAALPPPDDAAAPALDATALIVTPVAPGAKDAKDATDATDATEAPDATVATDAAAPPPEPAHAWSLAAGGGAGVVSGAAPSLLVSVPIFVELSRAPAGAFEPSARLRFERTVIGGGDATGEEGGGQFGLTTGALDLCPVALRSRLLRAQPCLRSEAGGLFARGSRVESPRSEVRPWLAFGPVARLKLDLAGPVFAELEGALLALMVRDRFVVDGASLVYRPPLVAARASFAVGVAFW
jgi:hypothetical protein